MHISRRRLFLGRLRGASADRAGVSSAEYAILAVGIILVIGAAVGGFRFRIRQALSRVGSAISSIGRSAAR